MATNVNSDGASSFKIKRPRITTNGFISQVDPTIKKTLAELNELLSKRVITPLPPGGGGNSSNRTRRPGTAVDPRVTGLLNRDLTPKRTPPSEPSEDDELWASESLAETFSSREESDAKSTLSEYVEMTAGLSSLKYAFDSNLSANWFNLDEATRTVLDYPAIKDYLIAFAYQVHNLQELTSLKTFIFSNRLGAKNVANYAIVSAARQIIDEEQLKVEDPDDDEGDLVKALKKAPMLSLFATSFKKALRARIADFTFNSDEAELIEEADKVVGPFPPALKPLLIQQIKKSPVKIKSSNANFYLPLMLSQIQGTTTLDDPTDTDTDPSTDDQEFAVEFFQDDTAMIQVSATAVKCAAQLYYAMTIGDELDVFNVVNYFTHKYLIRGGLEIQNRRLRDDLQMYVFSNKFTDLKTKKIIDRTRPAERQMFYRQVFNWGNGQITPDVIVNDELPKLWKVMILESAKYLERAQSSFNPDSYVSRQNVMQAVEDLQYNLSTHCTGMANVITPIIYSELNFVIQRIFMHPEILRQVVPQGGTWWRVVEALYMGMNQTRPRSTVLYNKAKLGHDIIRSIADYDPSTFEDDKNFSAFISNVDAFITTQSILQEALVDDLKKTDAEESPAHNGYHTNGNGSPMPDAPAMAAASGPTAQADEWDF